jgi:hypothetical protein
MEIIRAQMELPIEVYDYTIDKNKAMIIKTFVEWAHMVGVKEPSTADENVINAKFIIANFGYMTISEVRQAIYWSITGKIPELDATCFGKLSPIYMSKILNAYLNIRDRQMKIMKYNLSQHYHEQKHKAKYDRPLEERIAEKKQTLIDYMTEMKIKHVGDKAGGLIWKFLVRANKVEENKFTEGAKKHAREKLEALQKDIDYRVSIKKFSQVKITQSEDNFILRCLQEYQIWLYLETVDDISEVVNNQPDDVIIPKEEH